VCVTHAHGIRSETETSLPPSIYITYVGNGSHSLVGQILQFTDFGHNVLLQVVRDILEVLNDLI